MASGGACSVLLAAILGAQLQMATAQEVHHLTQEGESGLIYVCGMNGERVELSRNQSSIDSYSPTNSPSWSGSAFLGPLSADRS